MSASVETRLVDESVIDRGCTLCSQVCLKARNLIKRLIKDVGRKLGYIYTVAPPISDKERRPFPHFLQTLLHRCTK